MKKKIFSKTLLLLASAVILISCSQSVNEINVYSGRHYRSDEDLFRKFTEKTGIKVNLIKADSDQLINRLALEGENSPADLFITADAGRIGQAVEQGLLQPVKTNFIEQNVPKNLRDADGYWVGLTKRARIIVYHRDRVDPAELTTYEDLILPKWKGKVLVRSSQSHYNQTLLASMVATGGYEQTLEWAKGLVNNMAQPPKGNDRDQVKAVAAGVGDLAIVNTYYMGLLLRSSNEEERQVAGQMGIFFPNQDDRGAHINVSAIGLTSSSKNKENAILLMEFLLEKEAQEVLAGENFEYPVNPDAKWPDLLVEWGEFKEDTVNLTSLGNYLPGAMKIFNEAGWN
jgi:iron(III) transport system substrate-binding protein